MVESSTRKGCHVLCVDDAGKPDRSFGLNGLNPYTLPAYVPQVLITGALPGARAVYVAGDSNWRVPNTPRLFGLSVSRMIETSIRVYDTHFPLMQLRSELQH
jgi:hypothetical protein